MGLIASAGYFMLSGVFSELSVVSLGILIGAIVIAGRWKVNPFFLIIVAGIIGAFFIR